MKRQSQQYEQELGTIAQTRRKLTLPSRLAQEQEIESSNPSFLGRTPTIQLERGLTIDKKKLSLGEVKMLRVNMVQLQRDKHNDQQQSIKVVKETVNTFFLRCCPRKLTEKVKEPEIQDTENKKLENFKEKIELYAASLSEKERLQKAVRHFYDAFLIIIFIIIRYLLRTPENDLDGVKNRVVRFIWLFLNSRIWNNLLWFLSLSFQFLAFWEPQFKGQQYQSSKDFLILNSIEGSILFFLLVDAILCTILKVKLTKKNKFAILLKQNKVVFKIIFITILIADFINNLQQYPYTGARFGRIVRALFFISYSKILRRYFRGLFNSLQLLFALFLLYFIIISMFSFIGMNLLGDIKLTVPLNSKTIIYDDYFPFSFVLYVLSTLDGFPDNIIPALTVSQYYLIYFVIFLMIFIILLNPIPQALVYDKFAQHRKNVDTLDALRFIQIFKQILRQQRALYMCFLCLDTQQNGEITYERAKEFFQIVYGDILNEDQIYELLRLLDFDDSLSFNIEEFNQIFQVCNSFPEYHLDQFSELNCWRSLRQYLNSKYKLDLFVKGFKFNITMTVIALINCTLLVISISVDIREVSYFFDILDYIFFQVYVFEALLKITGLGVQEYFSDIWNRFDFSLVLIQFLCDFVLVRFLAANVSNSIQANRVVRFTKLQKIFRLFKVIRSVKLFTLLIQGLQVFSKVNDLLYKIILCIPVVAKFLVVIWIFFYIYAVIGVELFNLTHVNSISNVYTLNSCDQMYFNELQPDEVFIIYDHLLKQNINWGNCQLSDFNSLAGTLIILFQTFMMNWSNTLGNLAYIYDGYFLVCFYLGTFVLFAIFLNAIVSGLVWEVFNSCTYLIIILSQQTKSKNKMGLRNIWIKIEGICKLNYLICQQQKQADEEVLLEEPQQNNPIETESLSLNESPIQDQPQFHNQ